MSNQPLQKRLYKVHGTHCSACEVLIERRFQKIPGVERVKVNHVTGKAVLSFRQEPSVAQLENTVRADGYTVSRWGKQPSLLPHTNSRRDYREIGGIFLIVVALYLLIKLFKVVPEGFGVTDNMSYGFIFVIGLVAAVSTCMAVTGGLLLAVAAKYNERHPELTPRQRFKPHLYFNIGRVLSYALLGGAVGALGSLLSLSSLWNGMLTIGVSLVMVLLGFQLLNIFPWLRRFQPRMPKFLSHRVHGLSEKENRWAPFLLGSATFFLPCGFTQALQLYVLSSGSFTQGALTMGIFALGTLPGLLSVSALSSFIKGAFQRRFLRFAGVVVILIGIFNIGNGLALARQGLGPIFESRVSGADGETQLPANANDPNVQLVDGVQVVEMDVVRYDYYPSTFTVQQNIPVEWRIDATKAAGCAKVVTMPKLNITKRLSSSAVTTIRFTPTATGTLYFSCTMGMTTPGAAFTVVPNVGTPSASQPVQTEPTESASLSDCDPRYAMCID